MRTQRETLIEKKITLRSLIREKRRKKKKKIKRTKVVTRTNKRKRSLVDGMLFCPFPPSLRSFSRMPFKNASN